MKCTEWVSCLFTGHSKPDTTLPFLKQPKNILEVALYVLCDYNDHSRMHSWLFFWWQIVHGEVCCTAAQLRLSPPQGSPESEGQRKRMWGGIMQEVFFIKNKTKTARLPRKARHFLYPCVRRNMNWMAWFPVAGSSITKRRYFWHGHGPNPVALPCFSFAFLPPPQSQQEQQT